MSGFRINTNIAALTTYRAAQMHNMQVAKSIERISSGKRINRAADDVAGYAITEKMESRIRSIRQAQQNAQDALSMLQIADSSLSSIQEMVQRIRQLAIQAANETYTSADRKKIQSEINQLLEGIDDVAYNTEFNKRKILVQNTNRGDQKSPKIDFQPYTGDNDWNNDGIDDWTNEDMDRLRRELEDIIIPAAFKKVYAQLGWGNPRTYNLKLKFTENENYIARANNEGLEVVLSYILGGKSGLNYTIEQLIAHEITHTAMYRETHALIPGGSKSLWYIEGSAEWSAVADADLLKTWGPTVDAGEANELLRGKLENLDDGPSLSAREYMEAYLAKRYIAMVHGDEKVTAIADAVENGANPNEVIPKILGFPDMEAFEAAFEAWVRPNYLRVDTDQIAEYAKIDRNGLAYTHKDPRVVWGNTPDIHIGPDAWELIETKLPDARVGALDFLAFANVRGDNNIKAEDTILTASKAIDILTKARSDIGARIVRLEGILQSLREQEEAQSASQSRIRDLDFAQEVMNLTRNQILTQATLAMLTQANVAPQNVLRLV